MKLRVFLLIWLFSITSISFAKWTNVGTINNIYSHNGYHVIVTTITDSPCGSPGKFWWPADDSDAKDMLSISLTALASQKNIAVVYKENTPDCKWSGQLATHISISK